MLEEDEISEVNKSSMISLKSGSSSLFKTDLTSSTRDVKFVKLYEKNSSKLCSVSQIARRKKKRILIGDKRR